MFRLLALTASLAALSPELASADAAAPSLEVRSDPDRPYTAFGASADAVGVAFGAYELRLDLAFSRYAAVTLTPGWHRMDGAQGPSLGAQLAILPMGRGVDGVVLSAGIEGRHLSSGDARRFDLGVSAELGYLYTWKGFLLGAAAGVRWRQRFGPQRGAGFEPIVRVLAGWSWS